MKLKFLILLFYVVTIGHAQIPSYIPQNGLVRYFPFSNNTNDLSSYGLNLTNNGGTFTTDRIGNTNKTINLSGNQNLVSNDMMGLPLFTHPRTFSFWVNPDFLYHQGQLIYLGDNTTTNTLSICIKQGLLAVGELHSEHISNCLIFSGIWQNITVVFGTFSNDVYIYSNGTLLDIFNLNISIRPNTLKIGGDALNISNLQIDDLAIWDRELSGSEIQSLVTNCTPPSPPTGAATQVVCPNGTLGDLQVTGTTIQWYDAPFTGNLLPSTTTIIDSTNYYATQTIDDCESTLRTEVTVMINDPQITASGTSICSGSAVTLTSSTTATGTTSYMWSTGETTATITPSPTTTTNYWCDITVNGVTCRKEITITVNPSFTSTFTQVAPICSGSLLSALPTTSNNGITGTWSPAINNTATTTYTFTPATGQCATTASMTITVDSPSIVHITKDDPNCNPSQLSWSTVNTINTTSAITTIGSNTITITKPSGGLFSTSSVFSGNSFPSQYNLPINGTSLANNEAGLFTFCFDTPVTNPQIAIASIGHNGLPVTITTSVPYQVIWSGPGMSYTNNQTLTGEEGYCIIVFPGTHQCISFDYLVAENYCNVLFGTQDTNCQIDPICSGESISLAAHGSTNITWSPSSSLTNLPNNKVIASPTQTTTYTITTNNTCQNQASITVTVNPNNTPTFTQVAPICSGSTLSALPTTSNNGISGTWSPAINNTSTTTYTFTPTVGQCATTATMTITVNPNNTPTFTQVAPICSGSTLSALPTTSNNGISGTWSPALNNTSTTTYTFTPTVGQCATTATMTITVNPLPQLPSGSLSQKFCASDSPKISNLILNTSNVNWYLTPSGGRPLAQNYNLIDQQDLYTAAFDSNTFCESSSKLKVRVTIENPVLPLLESSIIFCNETEPTTKSISTNGISMIWNDRMVGGNLIPSDYILQNKEVLYGTSINLNTGCKSLQRIRVQILINDSELSYYNLITIDGNENNSALKIIDIENYPDNNIDIYNRYGLLVWSTTNYNNTDNAFKGMSNVSNVVSRTNYLPSGTYFFVLNYSNSCQQKTLKGYVQIENIK
jgi:hypothetical protein